MTNSINKGKRAEREIVNILKKAGIPAKRISMQETGGIDKGDVVMEVAGVWKTQVKCGSHVPKAIYKFMEHEDICFVKRDREKWVIMLDLELFLNSFI